VDSYKIPKNRVRVVVRLGAAPPVDGLLFLSAFAQSHQGSETVFDLIEYPGDFLPLLRGAGNMYLVRKDRLRWLRIDDPKTSEWFHYQTSEGLPLHRVSFRFDARESLEGTIVADGPVGVQRVLDVINRREGFIHVEGPDGLYLVNLRQVAHIRIIEEALRGGA
jgi:hypothetical protein